MKSAILAIFGLLISISQGFASEVVWTPYSGHPLSDFMNASTKDVTVPAGQVAYINQDMKIRTLTINGQLHCLPDAGLDFEVRVSTIYVNGLFQCGTLVDPVAGHVTFSMTPRGDVNPVTNPAYRGFIVNPGGQLIMSGMLRNYKWSRLKRPAKAGDTRIVVPAAVTSGWRVGDVISIAGTGFLGTESESHQIKELSNSIVTLTEPLSFDHWAGVERYTLKGVSYTLNESAEVANLTRHILVRSDQTVPISDGDEPGAQLGGHMMVMQGGAAYVSGIELDHLGQAGIMARYPFHWHIGGDAPGQFIQYSSIHDSYQRCVTVHATNQVVVKHNVCFKFKGHGFFLENGSEHLNSIIGNLAMGSMAPSRTKILLASDNIYQSEETTGTSQERFPPVANFWLSNPDNVVANNVAAGGIGTGFWMAYDPEVHAFNPATGHFDGPVIATPATTNLRLWRHNVAHSLSVGHVWDGVPSAKYAADPALSDEDASQAEAPHNPNNPNDKVITTNYYNPPRIPVIDHLMAYKNRRTGMYFRGFTALFTGALYADNRISHFVAKNQILKDSVIVGRSRNDDPAKDLVSVQRSGVVLYDGPQELQNVGFFNFDTAQRTYEPRGRDPIDTTATPIGLVGGANRYTNIVSGLTFSPEPLYRIFNAPDNYRLQNDQDISTKIRDLDGSFTGVVGGSILPTPVASAGCVANPKFVGYSVCPPQVNDAVLWLNSSYNGSYVPFVVDRIPDGRLSLPQEHWDLLLPADSGKVGGTNRKVRLIAGQPAYEYRLAVAPIPSLRVGLNSEYPNTVSPVIYLKQFGSGCRLVDLSGHVMPQVASVGQLRSTQGVAYYSSGNEFAFRLKTEVPISEVVPNTIGSSQESVSSSVYSVSCGPLNEDVIGVVEASVTQQGATSEVHGWACQPKNPQALKVRLYANAPMGASGAIFVAETTANVSSEAAVNINCGNLNEQGYRFQFSLPTSSLRHGQKVYVTGISPNASQSAVLANSGTFVFP